MSDKPNHRLPEFDQFHNGDPPMRVEFSQCRLECSVICRLAMLRPDGGKLLVRWYEDKGEANRDRFHLEPLGYRFVRLDSFRAF